MRTLKASVLLVLGFFICSMSQAQSLEKEAREKIRELEKRIQQADKKGIDTQKERLTVRTSEIFLKYANWDEANVAFNTDAFKNLQNYRDIAFETAEGLASYERKEVIKILDEAILNIQKYIQKEYVRKPGVKVDYSKVKMQGNRVMQNGTPVFLVDHVWKPGIPELNEFYGAFDKDYISTGWLNEDLKLDEKLIEAYQNKKTDRAGFVFLDHNRPPAWAYKKYDNFSIGSRHYGTFDIDNPGAKELYSALFKQVVPRMANQPGTEFGYMLFNEPSFFTQADVWNTGEVSKYTKDKFRVWLRNRHKNIEALNRLWGTDFDSFETVQITIPIDGALQGTPIWYDWNVFNNYRVSAWFRFLRDEIHKYAPGTPVHIKLMPWLWTKDKKDHGMDFESLIRLSGISGADAQAYNSNMAGTHEPWMDKYALEWKHMSMTYDFYRSIRPEQLILDSESHFLSTVRFRNLQLEPEYARCIYWLAHMHGLNASTNWVWSRRPSGEVPKGRGKGHAGSNMQQPAIMNEVHATMIDLNTYSNDITAMQLQRKPLRIYYSLANAISRASYMEDIYDSYQSLYFDGVPLGFMTDSIFIEESASDWDAVIIRETEVVTKQEFDQIQKYVHAGGTILLDHKSLKKTPYGKVLPMLKKGKGSIIKIASIDEMQNQAALLLSARNLLPDIRVNQSSKSQNKTCVWRSVKNAEGNNVLSVVNVGNEPVQLKIKSKLDDRIRCTDLLRGVEVSSTPVLQPYEVYFVEVKGK